MGDREAARVLDALEAYLARRDTTRALREAFLAGVAVGRTLGAELSTLSTASVSKCENPLPPNPPLNYLIGSEKDPDPDLRSIECASARALELELFPLAAAREVRPKPRYRLPEDFCLTAALRAFAEAGGLDAAQEFAAFKDHYRATGEPRANWSASFREWCRRARYFTERANGRRGLR